MADKISKRELKMRTNFFDLKRDEFMSLSEYLVSPLAVTDLGGEKFVQGGAVQGRKKKVTSRYSKGGKTYSNQPRKVRV